MRRALAALAVLSLGLASPAVAAPPLVDVHVHIGSDALPRIDHIVVLMLENHTYDNFLGMLGKGDGFTLDASGRPTATNPYTDGRIQHAFHMPTTCQLSARPSNEWAASHNAYDGGRNDGFVRTPISPTNPSAVGGVAMGYWDRSDLPFTYSLADAFPIADRWFSSALVQTDPERRFLIGATAAGMTDDIGTSTDNAVALTRRVPVPLTIFNELDLFGISWTNYATDWPLGADPEPVPHQRRHHRSTPLQELQRVLHGRGGGEAAVGHAARPAVRHAVTGEPAEHRGGGAAAVRRGARGRGVARMGQHAARGHLRRRRRLLRPRAPAGGRRPRRHPAARAVGAADLRRLRALRLPGAGFVVSPYARPGYVSHTIYDHTSILKMIERKWHLPALSRRDATANDLTDFLDADAMQRGVPTFPTLPALAAPGDTPDTLACSTTGAGVIPPPASISAH